jgi:hypothetical protein
MSAPRRFKISSNEVAAAYGCTRQNANVLLRRYGPEIVENPDKLFAAMLERQASQIRFKLTCPDFRKRAALSLDTAAFRFGLSQGLKATIAADP